MNKRSLSLVLAFCFLLAVCVPAAFAAEEKEKPALSLDDAINMALDRNRNLKIQKLNLDKSTEQLDDLRTEIDHQPTSEYIAGTSETYSSYLSTATSERAAKKTLAQMKQQMVVDVKELYYDILTNKRQVQLAQEDLGIARIKLAQARLKNQLGMLTRAELLSFETQVESSNTALVTAQNTLAESYSKLATLIGASGEFQPELTDDAVFEKADFVSEEAVIARALSASSEVWAAERTAEVAKRVRQFSSNYNVSDIESNIKAVEAGNVKEQMREQVKSLYLSLQNLEENHTALEQKGAMLQETARVVKVQQEVGMATTLQLKEAEQAYEKALDGLRQLVYQYDLARTQLEVLTGEDVIPEEA